MEARVAISDIVFKVTISLGVRAMTTVWVEPTSLDTIVPDDSLIKGVPLAAPAREIPLKSMVSRSIASSNDSVR